jgi:hypothetical protein
VGTLPTFPGLTTGRQRGTDMSRDKEVYRLWFEYLKRSPDYKEFCDLVRQWEAGRETKCPEKFKKFGRLYLDFGNVHDMPFKDWWEWKSARIGGDRVPAPVENYLEGWASVERDLDGCIQSFKRFEGREPSADELKRYFMQTLQCMVDKQSILFLRVDLSNKPADLMQSFKDLLRSPSVKKNIQEGKRSREFTGKPRLDELQKYLDVYDLWIERVKNRKPGDPGGWDTIIKHFEPRRKGDQGNIRREYFRYKQIAMKIIGNVEKGVFPGTY